MELAYVAQILVCSLTVSRIDYCNAVHSSYLLLNVQNTGAHSEVQAAG